MLNAVEAAKNEAWTDYAGLGWREWGCCFCGARGIGEMPPGHLDAHVVSKLLNKWVHRLTQAIDRLGWRLTQWAARHLP